MMQLFEAILVGCRHSTITSIEEHPHPADLARELLMPKPTVTHALIEKMS